MWESILIVFNIVLCVTYYILTFKFGYWKKKNVPYLQPIPLFGNYKDHMLLKTCLGKDTKNMCEQFPEEPYIGVYFGTEPTLIVQDPELLKLIMTKDFYYFNGREISKYAGREPVTQSVFFSYGDHWKVVRQNMTPLFSSAKMKNMFHLVEKCTHTFEKLLEYETTISNCIESKKLFTRFTMDCIGSCAFGIDINLMQKDYDKNPFRKLGDLIFGDSDIRGYKNIFRAIWPKLFYLFGLQSFPAELEGNMTELVTNVFKARQYKPTSRNDFIDLLLSFENKEYWVGDSMSNMIGDSKKAVVKLDDDVMVSLCVTFFGGGFETTATTLALTVFELAKNKDAQLKAQKEIDEYLLKHDNKIDYDCVSELPYLSACVDETLRLHPVFNILTREVMENYTLPDGLQLDKGIRIHIPVYHIHHNSRNFFEPEQYRPERFLPEERHKIKPFTYMPFGEGPRACIGMRFGKMEVQAGLITVLKKYNISLAEGMPETIDYDPRMLISHVLENINLKYEPRQNNLANGINHLTSG